MGVWFQAVFSLRHKGKAMQGDIVAQGVELMLYGMGTVVLFLALLVVATTGMSRIIGRYFAEPDPAETPPAPRTVGPARAADDAQLVAVISAAIQQHRASRK